MKYLYLVYVEGSKFPALSTEEQRALDRDSLAYDRELERTGHFIAAEALQSVEQAATVRVRASWWPAGENRRIGRLIRHTNTFTRWEPCRAATTAAAGSPAPSPWAMAARRTASCAWTWWARSPAAWT